MTNWPRRDAPSTPSITPTAEVPCKSVTPMPASEWQAATAPLVAPPNGTITVRSLPGVTGRPLSFFTNTPITWSDGSNDSTALLLPQALQALVASTRQGDRLRLRVSRGAGPTTTAPPATPSPAVPVSAIPALLVSLSISRVPSNPDANAIAADSPQPGTDCRSSVSTRLLPHVYAVGCPDDAARDLIGAALDSDLSTATVSLLCTPRGASRPVVLLTPAGLQSDPPPALIVRTRPPAPKHFRLVNTSTLGEDAATTRDVSEFLRLLSEASPVDLTCPDYSDR